MGRSKVTVIGAGNVGASLAQVILAQQLGDVVLVDINEGVAKGKALDLNQAGTVLNYTGVAVGTNDYAETAGSDVIVVTSGSPRKPGMSRDDLLKINFDIVKSVVEQAARVSPDAIIIVVTNPLDAMTYTAFKASGFAANKVVGMAGILDSARYRWFLAEALKVSPHVVDATVLGGHGDDMVPCVPLTRVAGAPVTELLAKDELDKIIQRTRTGGGEIVKLLQTGSAYYAPAASTAKMVASILKDERAVLPCATLLNGEYGYNDIFLGVPVVVSRSGIEKIVEVELADDDKQALARSAEAVKALCAQIDELLK